LILTAGQFTFIFSLIALSFTRNIPITLTLILLIGWGTVTALAMMNTLIQLEVPDTLRGRVFATYLWALQGVAPFGSLSVGWMAQNWGLSATALIAGSTCLIIIGGLHLLKPELRMREA
jgi:hypothetical protein